MMGLQLAVLCLLLFATNSCCGQCHKQDNLIIQKDGFDISGSTLYINFDSTTTVNVTCLMGQIAVTVNDGRDYTLNLNRKSIILTRHNIIQGKYTCRCPEPREGVHVYIRRTPTFLVPEKPVINANISETVRVPCTLNGRPGVKYELQWYKVSDDGQTIKEIKKLTGSGVVNCSLEIEDVSVSSTGLYQCKVKKIADKDISFVSSMPIDLNVIDSAKRSITINMVMDIHLNKNTTSHTIQETLSGS